MDNGVWTRTTNPIMSHVGRAYVAPCSVKIGPHHVEINDCIYDANGDWRPEYSRNGGSRGDGMRSVGTPRIDIEREHAVLLPGKALYIGNVFSQYGHFITETLSRLWSDCGQFSHLIAFPIARYPMSGLLDYHRFFFNKLGIDEQKIIFPDRLIQCEDLYVPEQLWVVNSHANRAMQSVYAQIQLSVTSAHVEKVFLSRSAGLSSRLKNMLEVETVFAQRGFEIVYPELIPIDEQLSLYKGADVLAGFSGSAMHNCIFSEKGATLIEIGDTRARNAFLPMQAIANELSGIKAERYAFDEDGGECINVDKMTRWLNLRLPLETRGSGHTVLKKEADMQDMVTMTPKTKRDYSTRVARVQSLLDLYDQPRYLEIGVSEGATFNHVRAQRKVAVDPQFLFDLNVERAKDDTAEFLEITSDAYFAQLDESEKFDVIFLDGLHTYSQTLRDFCNAITVLSPGGAIIIDDVMPCSYAASLSSPTVASRLRQQLGDKNAAWMGDVYRVVFFIDSFFKQFKILTSYGDNLVQSVAFRGKGRSEGKNFSAAEVADLPFESVFAERQFYGLTPFAQILDQLRELHELSAQG